MTKGPVKNLNIRKLTDERDIKPNQPQTARSKQNFNFFAIAYNHDQDIVQSDDNVINNVDNFY